MILVIVLILSMFGGGYGYRRGNNVLAGGCNFELRVKLGQMD